MIPTDTESRSVGQAYEGQILRAWLPYAVPLVLLLALAALIRAHGQLPYPDAAYLSWDHYKYIAMAAHPLSNDPLAHVPPFCWRILTPLLVYWLHVPAPTGFWVVTVVGLTWATASLMWFLKALGLSRSSAVMGGLVFVLLPQAVGFTLWDFMLVDPLAFALQVTAFACAVSRRGPLLLLTLTLYAFAKETALFAVLFAIIYSLEVRDWRMLRWAIAGLFASGAAQVVLHVAIPADQPYSLFAQYQLVQSMFGQTAYGIINRVVEVFAGTWMALLLIAALQLIHRPHMILRPSFLVVFVGATAQVLVSINVSRVVVYAFPVVIAAVAFEIERLASHSRLWQGIIWTVVLLAQLPWFVAVTALTPPASGATLALALFEAETAILLATFVVVLWAISFWIRQSVNLQRLSG